MTPADIHTSTGFLMTLAGAAVRSLALGCLAATALALFRTKSVRVRLFVWKGVLLAALAMPVLMLVGPAVQVAVRVPSLPERSAAASSRLTEPPITEAAPVARLVPNERPKNARRAREQQRSGAVPIISEAGLPIAPVPVPKRREIPWTLILFSVYAATAAALFVRVLVGIYFSNRLVRFALSVDEPWALRALAAASRATGLRNDPYLAESETLAVPVMVGVFKPTILLTPGWQEWDSDEFAAVLAHEVSHVARRDALGQRLALIHRAIFWFSPLSWWLERHLADLAEQASDDAALAAGADRTRYAETLLGFFAELEAGPERVWWQGVSMAKAGQAEQRVDRILSWRSAMSNQLRRSFMVAIVAIAAPVVALTAAVRPSAYTLHEAPKPTAPQAPPSPIAVPAPNPNPMPAPDPNPLPMPSPNPTPPPAPVAANPPVAPMAPPAQDAPAPPPVPASTSHSWSIVRSNDGSVTISEGYRGPRFVIVQKDSDAFTMSGTPEDAEHARALRGKIPGEFIWFDSDGKFYIIRDHTIVDLAKKLWEPGDKLGKEQEALGKEQEALGNQQSEAAEKMDEIRVKIPDMSADLQKLAEKMKVLSANGGTLEDLGDLQGEIGELQGRIGEVQGSIGSQAGEFGRQQGELGRKQGELGRRQGELGRQQAERAREAARQMKELLDDAIAHGLAKPE